MVRACWPFSWGFIFVVCYAFWGFLLFGMTRKGFLDGVWMLYPLIVVESEVPPLHLISFRLSGFLFGLFPGL